MSNFQLTPKFALLIVALVMLGLLLGANTIEWDAGGPLITAIVFYGLGNGIAVAKGQPIRSAIEAKEPPDSPVSDE